MQKQLEKELRFHLDQHAGDVMARGATPEEARREARRALGGQERVKEKCRDAILALGMDASTVMFTVVNSVVSRSAEARYGARIHEQFGEFWGFSYPDFEDVRRESRSLTAAA